MTHMDTAHPKDAVTALWRDARARAADYHDSMGDPMYALSSSGALVYAGRVTLIERLLDDAATAVMDPDGDGDDAATFSRLAGVIHRAMQTADTTVGDRDDVGDEVYGVALGTALRAVGIPVGDPTVETGWSRGPRWVLPAMSREVTL